jgi:hypothetical protein
MYKNTKYILQKSTHKIKQAVIQLVINRFFQKIKKKKHKQTEIYKRYTSKIQSITPMLPVHTLGQDMGDFCCCRDVDVACACETASGLTDRRVINYFVNGKTRAEAKIRIKGRSRKMMGACAIHVLQK